MINPKLLGIILCVLSMNLKAWAGEFLTPQDLVKRSEAIAFVNVNLHSNQVKVIEWLMTAPQDVNSNVTSTQLKGLSTSHCLPDQKGIQRWMHRFGQVKSRQSSQKLWKHSLAVGHYDSIIFLKRNSAKKSFVATCETEVMEVRQWSIHPKFDQFKALIQTLIVHGKSTQN